MMTNWTPPPYGAIVLTITGLWCQNLFWLNMIRMSSTFALPLRSWKPVLWNRVQLSPCSSWCNRVRGDRKCLMFWSLGNRNGGCWSWCWAGFSFCRLWLSRSCIRCISGSRERSCFCRWCALLSSTLPHLKQWTRCIRWGSLDTVLILNFDIWRVHLVCCWCPMMKSLLEWVVVVSSVVVWLPELLLCCWKRYGRVRCWRYPRVFEQS